MAKSIRNTPRVANEASPPEATFTHTPISALFSQLLSAMAFHVECERDIETVDIWAPAFRLWLAAAESSATTVTTLISQIRLCSVARKADLPLLRMTVIADTLLGAETPDEFIAALAGLSHPTLFACPSGGPVGHRIMAMIRTAKTRLHELATLEAYEPVWRDEAPTEDFPPAMQLAA